jgi:hypothetical protein
MKKFLNLGIAAILVFSFYACEKDDICAGSTPTTSRLVVEFYDFTNPTVKKSVTGLSAFGNGNTTGVVLTENGTDITKYFYTGTSTFLPLDISQDTTSYRLRLNSQSTNPLVYNDDVITIDYAREEIYVSRACGYKTIFDLNNATRTSESSTTTEWIKNITFEPIIIDNENEVHVKIFF